jgi:hypothetical protein
MQTCLDMAQPYDALAKWAGCGPANYMCGGIGAVWTLHHSQDGSPDIIVLVRSRIPFRFTRLMTCSHLTCASRDKRSHIHCRRLKSHYACEHMWLDSFLDRHASKHIELFDC